MSDEFGGWRGGANKSKRQKVPGRGPGVAQLEKIMRLGDDPQDTTSTCAFTFPSHYAPPFLLAPPPPQHPPVMGFGPPPHPVMPRGFYSTDDKSKQILAHPQYSQPLTPMMNPPFWKIVESRPSSNGLIIVEPPSNQRFNHRITKSALLQTHQGPFICNHQPPDPFSDHTTTNTCLNEINPRETKMVKWGVSECGSSFQGRTSNESRSRGRHVVPFYNFIQPKEYLKEKDDEEGGNMDLDLDLKL